MNRFLAILFICLFCQTKMQSQPSAITPEKYQAMLGNGLDVDWWGRKSKNKYGDYSDQAVIDFKKMGVTHTRIRIHHYDFSPSDFARLDHQIEVCLKHGVIPIIAFSAKPYKKSPTVHEHNRVVAWWEQMARHCSEHSPLVSFDLIIEPSETLKKKPDRLNKLYEECVTMIRRTNPKRIIFIAPHRLSHPDGLETLKIPSQANGYLMVEWHFYASGPDKSNPNKLWTKGTAHERKIISGQIEQAAAYQQKTGIHTWVGAWMPGNYNKGDDYSIGEQTAFARFMKNELRKHDIPFAVNSDKVFYDYSQNCWKAAYKPLVECIFGNSRQ